MLRQELGILKARERELKMEMRQLSKQDLDLQDILSHMQSATADKSSGSTRPKSRWIEDEGFETSSSDSSSSGRDEAERHRKELTATEEAAMTRLHELADEEWALEQQICKQQVALRGFMICP